MKSNLTIFTAKHKQTGIKAEFTYKTLEEAAHQNPSFKDFEIVGYK